MPQHPKVKVVEKSIEIEKTKDVSNESCSPNVVEDFCTKVHDVMPEKREDIVKVLHIGYTSKRKHHDISCR